MLATDTLNSKNILPATSASFDRASQLSTASSFAPLRPATSFVPKRPHASSSSMTLATSSPSFIQLDQPLHPLNWDLPLHPSAKLFPTQLLCTNNNPRNEPCMGYNRLINHPWNLDTSPSVCFIFKHTTPHWKKTNKSWQYLYSLLSSTWQRWYRELYSASVSTPKRPSLSLSKILASSSAPGWSSRPSAL